MSYYGEHVPDPYPGGEPDEYDYMAIDVLQAMRELTPGSMVEQSYDVLKRAVLGKAVEATYETRSKELRDALVRLAAVAATFALEIDRREQSGNQLTWDERRSLGVSSTQHIGKVDVLLLPEDADEAAALIKELEND